MRRGKNKKQLQEQLESLQKCLEEKTAECSQYVTTIAELNKKNFEYKEKLDEYKRNHEKQKQSAPSPARIKEINSHLEKWGAEKIQSTYRGRLARKKLEEKINELADFDEDTFASKYCVPIENHDLHTNTTITSSDSDNKLDANIYDDASMEQAAIKIQAAHRGRKSRVEIADKIADERSRHEAKHLPAQVNTREIRTEQAEVTNQSKAAAATTVSKVITTVPTGENHSCKHENGLEAAMPPDGENAEDEEKPKRVKSIPYRILSKAEEDTHGRKVTHHVGRLISDEEGSLSENSSESDDETLSSDEESA
eukprot:g478.t1